MKAIDAAKLVATLAAAYRDSKISPETSRVYESLLADLDLEVAKEAVLRLIATSKWLPTIAEIRSTAVDIERGPVRSGGEAYGDVLAEIRRTGHYGVPRFNDPLVARCVEMMTWRGLCLGDNEASDRARFIELYENLASRARTDIVAGRALPSPPAGLALASRIGWLRELPAPRSVDTVTRAELEQAATREPTVTAPGRRWTAEELDAELRKASGQ